MSHDTKKARLFDLFWTFCRIGPSAFGGGYAMIPIIEREAVAKRQWIPESELGELLTVAGTAPGGVGVNAAAFIGYRTAGVPGAIAAVAGITLPTFLIVFLLGIGYSTFEQNAKVAAALQGIHGAVIALIAAAAYKMAKTALFDKATAGVAAIALLLLLWTPVHPAALMAMGVAAGLGIVRAKERLGMRVQTERAESGGGGGETYYPEYYI
ncbi:chromate transporter [Paenibacillus methanolicus]|uniref:Chromate transporter n=1 Tax=Paenibacillus methanolicus TaxID=582686 RepID=A0A5S5CGZ7_9BACL|nr:chromate transporter [Paenibacillus methanolicus]TYP79059.1 chromate transporter [Paenibacillus methanolicus]